MIQLDLFTKPPAVFPWHRRTAVLRDIADTFVRDGFDAGNQRMMQHGVVMIAELFAAGATAEEVHDAISKFNAAWRALTIPRMVNQHRENQA